MALVQVVHPEVVRLADARVVFTEQDNERSLLEDPTVDPLIEINDPPIKLESDSFAGIQLLSQPRNQRQLLHKSQRNISASVRKKPMFNR